MADGLRLDTLPQPLKEEYCCAFSPDGRFIVAGGADNTIRVWKFVSRDKPQINPMVQARFAHEGPVVRLVFTPDGTRLVSPAEDRTIKVWDATDFTEISNVGRATRRGGRPGGWWRGTSFCVGRMDGSLDSYALPGPARSKRKAPRAPRRRGNARAAGGGAASRAVGRDASPTTPRPEATVVDVPAEITGTIAGKEKPGGRPTSTCIGSRRGPASPG